MPRKKKKNNIVIGIDTLEVEIQSTTLLHENTHIFRSANGAEIGRMKAVKNGYRLSICLPKMLREDNIEPFNVNDFKAIQKVLSMIQKELKQLFDNTLLEMTVKSCEVNSTIQLSDKTKTEPLLQLLSHVLLTKGEKLFVAYTGTRTGKRYEAVKNLCNGKHIESIKTPKLSNSRFCFKIYDKGFEQSITDKGLLRIEFVYSVRGLKHANTGRTLKEFLTVTSINNLLECYRTDYKTYLVDRYWNNLDSKTFVTDVYSKPIYKEMVEIIYNDLCSHKGQPLTVAIMNKELIEIDFKLFEKACCRYYGNPESARKTCYRVKKSEEIQINEGIIDEFVTFSRAIIYGDLGRMCPIWEQANKEEQS